MAKCEKCNNQFYSKECPHCKRVEWEKNLNKNNKVDGSKYNPKATKIFGKNHEKICNECGKEYLTSVCVPCRHKKEKLINSNTNYSNKKHANFAIRFMASLIDGIIIGIPISLLLSTGLAEALIAIITITLWIAWSGQSVGKKLLNIKIVDEQYNNINIQQAMIRYIGYFISMIPFFIGYAIVPFREDRKALHDLVAKTIVIHTDKENTYRESDTTDKILAIFSMISGTSLMITMIISYFAVQSTAKMIYGTTDYDKIEKINNQTRKRTDELMKNMNMQNQSIMEMNNQMLKQTNEAMKKINQGFKINNNQRGN